nr:immunoglobulin heavy chain junction region [Macaca mulatta]MOV86801.1 immunoglobulin heavy chain junction region [Macaca mulatta]MOV86896.1 immunoglobulin heavy chain junction region [Macaca mulatta]MOV87952.1 immunoglobulin heavy chain junction region [Macaca mulatta]MOV88163.1 immunoglobulin heavy chain junction region [Macaca mulatta]
CAKGGSPITISVVDINSSPPDYW